MICACAVTSVRYKIQTDLCVRVYCHEMVLVKICAREKCNFVLQYFKKRKHISVV